MKKLRVMSVFGTRPEAIKMAPLVLELGRRPEIESLCCVTAQHREMLDSVLASFGVKPDFDLDIMEPNQSLYTITTKVLNGLAAVFAEAKPDLVLVHGDTSTTFAGALAAFYGKLSVGHVEAGLRTYDRYSPFPEEMNRRLTSQLASLHFCPTANNAANLRRESVAGELFVTGNTVIDAMRYTVRGDAAFDEPALRSLDFSGRRVITVTCHRRENYGEPMRAILTAIRRVAEDFPDVEVAYPVHLSPAVQAAARGILGNLPNMRLLPPLDTIDMHNLMARSYMVMTDSGGLQEEAPSLGKPVLVLRRETERPEAVDAGTVRLVGVEERSVYESAAELLTDEAAYERMARAVNPYGDGQACRRTADAILWANGLRSERPEDFSAL